MNGYNDITPRVGLAYDVFGNGKTSVKVNFGKYLDAASNNNGNYTITNPTVAHGRQHRGRAACDHADVERQLLSDGNPRRGDCDPDCDLLLPGRQRRCLRAAQRSNFGTTRLSNNFDPAMLEGWGVRPADWQFGVVGPAGNAAARVGGGRLLPALAPELLRERQPRHDAGRLHAVQHHGAGRLAAAGRRRLQRFPGSTTSSPTKFGQINNFFTNCRAISASGTSTTTGSC